MFFTVANILTLLSLLCSGQVLAGYLQRNVAVAEGPGPGRVLIWSGLRVRMGLHSGVKAADVLVRKEDLRTLFSGR